MGIKPFWELVIRHSDIEDLTLEQREELYNELVTVEDALGSILNRYGIIY